MHDQLHKDMFAHLDSKFLSPENFNEFQEIKQTFVQSILGTLHNVVQRARNARETFRECQAVDVLQPFREASDFQVERLHRCTLNIIYNSIRYTINTVH